MIIKMLNGIVTAEGDPIELALYTYAILDMIKTKNDIDMAEKEKELLDKFGDFSITDLIKRELHEDTKEDDKKDGGEKDD